MNIQDFLAAIAVVINGLPQALLALTYGFAAFPTALAFLVGSAGMLIFQQVAPISFQAESIVMAGTLGRDRNERLNIVFFTGLIMAILGALGIPGADHRLHRAAHSQRHDGGCRHYSGQDGH